MLATGLLDWLRDPWIWVGLGLVLLLAEIAVPGYLMLSFGLGAFLMALGLPAAGWLGLAPDAAPLLPLLLGWALASAVAAGLIWKFWRGRSRGTSGRDDDVNDFKNRL
ncbi:MAG: hypothetical protein CML46_09080 [Rhodobacteraceae bacterium]|nr:hypothetical protein [Paracoccaceae bacterium]MBR27078.1 hypothetical protein [Paracoccaceae bacterium]